MSQDPESTLLELLFAVREENDDSARSRLNELLRQDPAHRAALARILVDESALMNRLRDDQMVAILKPTPRRPAQRHTTRPPRSRDRANAMAIAAVILFCACLAWLALRTEHNPLPPPGPSPVAMLQEEIDAVWQGDAPGTGSSLTPGPLKLSSGMASLEFASGARILLEGPAEIELLSGNEVSCHSGNLLATVPPPAHGFAIRTPFSRVVDLGTVFGLQVRSAGDSLVKVMQGEVEIHANGSPLLLTDDKAATVDSSGNTRTVTASDAQFPSVANFNDRIAASRVAIASRWKAASESLARDPATLLAYHFSEAHPSARSVRNYAPGASIHSHASLVGTGWTDGRWPGKRALEFSRRGDRMLFRLNGTHPATTLMAWVRVDSLQNLYQILLMPDAYRPAALSWMLDGTGNLRLAITNGKSSPGEPEAWDGPVRAHAISDLDLGRWVFLASTYDSTSGSVRHYRDGTLIGQGTFGGHMPVVFGTYTFGNWDQGDRNVARKQGPDAYRNFNGRLDEIAILSRALNEEEIQAFYQAGKP